MLWMLWVAAVGQSAFVVMWASFPWWRQWIGRALMTKSVSLCALLWLIILGAYHPDHWGRATMRDLLFGLMCVGVWFQVWALWHEARQQRNPAR